MEVRDVPETSMGLVKARDREGWLALFAEDAMIEDPVGPAPWDPEARGQRGKAEIAAFHDMFSAMQDGFDFEVHEKFVCGREVAVLVSMHITGKDGAQQTTRAINIYRLGDDGRIASLRSFWNG